MTRTQSRPVKKRHILLICLTFILGFSFFVFKLFEPVFVWNTGWKPLQLVDRTDGEQHPVPEAYRDIIISANKQLDAAISTHNFPALSIAIGHNGKLVWARAMGVQNLETQAPVKLDTKFRIGSVSKAVTATAAAKLVDENVLNLDDNIRETVPYFPQKQYDITPRQLLTHTAGIRHYEACFCFPFDEYSNRQHHKDVKSAVSKFSKSKLLFKPGTAFSYSSYGFTLASAAMEGASGLSFDEIIKNKLTAPLGMNNTMREGLANGDIAVPYDVRDNTYKPAFSVDNSNKTAGGGFVSTPTDLVLMTQAILQGEYISDDLRDDLFFTPQKLQNGEVNEQNYAFGWRSHMSSGTFNEDRKVMITHHGGVAMGGTAFLIMYPEYDISIAIVTNRQMDGVGELVNIVQSVGKDMILYAESE